MRTIFAMVATGLVMALLVACTASSDEADDDSVSAEATETPVMNTQQTGDESDDTAVDDADTTDDALDDTESDDATDDSATGDVADDTAADDEEVAEPVEHTIEILEENAFSPSEMTIAPGDTVIWVNNTDEVHTSSADPEIATDPSHVQLPEGADTWHSGNIEPGEEYSVTLDVPGTYVYFCYPHQDHGMIGTIVVGDEDVVDDGETDDVDVDDPAPEDDESEDVVDPDHDAEDLHDEAETVEETYVGKDRVN